MRGLPILLFAACAAKQPAPTKPLVAKTAPQSIVLAPRPASRIALTADLVVSTIRDRYLAGVERCYRRHAKLYGTGGRVMLSFAVDRNGQTSDASARGIARRVDGCITAQLARWQFPAPAKRTQFALSLALSPD